MKLRELLVEGQLPQPGREFTVLGEIFQATKKQTMLVVLTSENMPHNSIFHKTKGNDINVVTSIGDNPEEAESTANIGDWIACGTLGEKWVINSDDFNNLYNIIDNIAYPKQEKSFLRIKTNTRKMVWLNSYNETNRIQKNSEYYLMSNSEKDLRNFNWKNINPMDIEAFKKTY